MLRAFPRETIGHANRVPLWVDATGADLRTPVNGLLHGWLLTSGGTWWGQVAFTLRSRNGDLNMDVMQLVRSDALTPEGDA